MVCVFVIDVMYFVRWSWWCCVLFIVGLFFSFFVYFLIQNTENDDTDEGVIPPTRGPRGQNGTFFVWFGFVREWERCEEMGDGATMVIDDLYQYWVWDDEEDMVMYFMSVWSNCVAAWECDFCGVFYCVLDSVWSDVTMCIFWNRVQGWSRKNFCIENEERNFTTFWKKILSLNLVWA